jgi:hypothetical protein
MDGPCEYIFRELRTNCDDNRWSATGKIFPKDMPGQAAVEFDSHFDTGTVTNQAAGTQDTVDPRIAHDP